MFLHDTFFFIHFSSYRLWDFKMQAHNYKDNPDDLQRVSVHACIRFPSALTVSALTNPSPEYYTYCRLPLPRLCNPQEINSTLSSSLNKQQQQRSTFTEYAHTPTLRTLRK